ncbi:hypothetical protein BpHYR1_046358 [Brachionus plicatilis]|uniref:Uncharacterized protein n=1 Tax=Brachionus plicatilis TaxID=10195 RepID=A0A3M7RGD4_BRAPC|nr:hypothetical protein BpHYR1_046358 [Brachionus plicatilis]
MIEYVTYEKAKAVISGRGKEACKQELMTCLKDLSKKVMYFFWICLYPSLDTLGLWFRASQNSCRVCSCWPTVKNCQIHRAGNGSGKFYKKGSRDGEKKQLQKR